MKNYKNWSPSKFEYRNGRLIGSRDKSELAPSSRLVADLVASLYELNIPEYAKGQLLDLGCGKAPLYMIYKSHVKNTICVDWENSLHANEHLDMTCDLTRPLPFDAEEFDTIILSDVLEHIPVPDKLCAEISRVLVEGGVLIMNVPFFYWIHESPHDYHRYTEYELKRLMKDAGLKVKKFEAVGGSPEVFADMLAKHLVSLPLLGVPIAVAVQSLTKAFVRTKVGSRISSRTSKVYPLGYFLVASKES